MPNVQGILLAIFDEWELQLINSFIVSPKIWTLQPFPLPYN